MSNLDLIGEMSLEQLENNVEALFGKAKAEELLHILHTTDVDASMKNKFYAAILNNIKSQNSIDNILKNPTAISHIIHNVEKEINELNTTTVQQNDFKNQEFKEHINTLLNNPEFFKDPLSYMQKLPEEELAFIFQSANEKLFKNKDFAEMASDIETNFYNNPNNPQYKAKFDELHDLSTNEDHTEYYKFNALLKTYESNNPEIDKGELLSSFLDYLEKSNVPISDEIIKHLAKNINLTPEQQAKKYKSMSDRQNRNDNIIASNNAKRDKNIFDKFLNHQNSDKATDDLYKYINSALNLSPEQQTEILKKLNDYQNKKDNSISSNYAKEDIFDIALEDTLNNTFSSVPDPAENQTEFEYGDLDTIFDDFADTNAMQFDFTDQEPIVETPPTASSPAEFIQQEMQKQAEEAEKIGDEISEQADLAQEADKENNYMLEVEEKKGFFSSIKDRFSKFMQRITQKSLPDPNATRAQTTNQSFESFERKTSILSTIRSIGDRVTSAVKNISSLNKQNQAPKIKNSATIIGTQQPSSQTIEMENNPSDTNKKSEIIRPKAVQSRQKTNELSSFDQFVKVSNEGNRIETAARKGSKASQEISDKIQDSQKISEDTSRDDD